MKRALILIDMQQGLLDQKPFQHRRLLTIIEKLLQDSRTKGEEVIYVCHHDNDLLRGSPKWQIVRDLKPRTGEKIFDKALSSIFKETGLHAYLQKQGISQLLLCGRQTNYCVDTSVKVAFELGYELILVRGGTSTFDSQNLKAADLQAYYEELWHNRFAQVLDLREIIHEKRYE